MMATAERISRGRGSYIFAVSYAAGFAALSTLVGLWPIYAPWWVLAIVLAVRGLRLGIYLTDSHVIVKEWLRTYRVDLLDIKTTRVAVYDGILNTYDFPPFLARLKVVEITLWDRPAAVRRFSATVTSARRCITYCQKIDDRRAIAQARAQSG